MKTTVVGIGNILLGDDGVGVWLVRRLLDGYDFSPEIEILDGGTLGLGLATYLADTGRLLIVDAVANGGEPGSIAVFHESDVPAILRATLSAHEASLCDLLAALTLLGEMPEAFVAIGIVPAVLEPSVALSAPVRAALAEAEARILEQLSAWGISATARGVVPSEMLTL